MTKPLADCLLYGILDLGYVAAADAPERAKQLLEGGVDILQIRGKQASEKEILALADVVAPICRAHGAPLILNDHPALVLRCPGATGAHIGQDDGPMNFARFASGVGAYIGRSTHSLDQARAARTEGADYLGFGPIFGTPTKPDYPPVGLGDIAAVHAAVPDRPIFCIGGIKLENLPQVLAAGARRVCIVSGLLLAADPKAYARECRALIADFRLPIAD